MKFLIIISLTTLNVSLSFAQDKDTLRHLSPEVPLTALKYDGPNQWGYITGHNHLGRQEYAEKYYIEGSASVTGIISHHQGFVTNKNNVGEFVLYSVDEEGLPGNNLHSTQWYFEDLDLSGSAHFTPLNSAVVVADSFFVSFNLTDYSHGGFEGDTLALMSGPDGSRDEKDLIVWGRNVTRFHNHSTPDYRDFYSQNGTPIATHFAIYPIIEFNENPITGIGDTHIAKNQLKLYPAYPNKSSGLVNIHFELEITADVKIQVMDMSGKVQYEQVEKRKHPGEHIVNLNLSSLASGAYVYILQIESTRLASRLLLD